MPRINKNSVRMKCPNPDCINKSEVFRQPDSSKAYCKACKTDLVYVGRVVYPNKIKSDMKAKLDLKRFENQL